MVRSWERAWVNMMWGLAGRETITPGTFCLGGVTTNLHCIRHFQAWTTLRRSVAPLTRYSSHAPEHADRTNNKIKKFLN
jgi:hypothetical protein